MKKPLVLVVLVAVALAGCTAGGPTLSKSDAEDVLFTADDAPHDAVMNELGQEDDMDIEDFLDDTTDDVDIEFDPEECLNSTFPLLLLDRDEDGPAGRVFRGDSITTALDSDQGGYATQWLRWFETPGEAASFFSQYRSEQAKCTEFTVDTDDGDVEVEADVEDAAGGDEAYVLNTEADYEDDDNRSGQQYVIRAGNVILMISGAADTKDQRNALQDLVDEAVDRLEDAAEDAAK